MHHVYKALKHLFTLYVTEGREMHRYAQISKVLNKSVLIALFMAVSVETHLPST